MNISWRNSAALLDADLDFMFMGDGPEIPPRDFEFALENVAPWAPWITLLILLVAAAIIAAVYLADRGNSTRRLVAGRALMAVIRFTLAVIVLYMLYGWVRRPYETDLPDLVVILDDSASMGYRDHFESEDKREWIVRLVGSAGLEEPSRFNLAKAILIQDDLSLLRRWQGRYHLKVYFLGRSARLQTESGPILDGDWASVLNSAKPTEKSSRLGKGLRDVLRSQRGRSTAAIIVLTDGITTEGATLSEAAPMARRRDIPLYLVGIGGDRSPRDVQVSDLLVEDTVFLGDLVHFDFKIAASGYTGQETFGPIEVRLKRVGDDRVLDKKTVQFDGDQRASRGKQVQSLRLQHRPDEKGEFEYFIEAQPIEGETNTLNNRLPRLITVRDQTIRVLLVQEYPNGDFRYLKHLLGRGVKNQATQNNQTGSASAQKAVDLITVLQEADQRYTQQDENARAVFPVSREELFQFDVVLFGDVDPSRLGPTELQNLADFVTVRGGGVVFTAGPRHTPLQYRGTALEPLFPMPLQNASAPSRGAALTESFRPVLSRLGRAASHMQLADGVAQSDRIWSNLPGVYWLLKASNLKPGVRVLAEHPHQTGSDGSKLPVICVQFVGAGKVVFHFTDDFWRWRFRVGDEYFARYWIQTIRYLSRSQVFGAGKTARLTSDQPTYRRGEPVRLRVLFLDDRKAPPTDEGVTIVIERAAGKTRFLKLTRSDAGRGVFEGTIADLPTGQYRAWMASPTMEGDSIDHTFRIEAPPDEFTRLVVDVENLKNAAKISQGRYYAMDQFNQLERDLPRGQSVRIKGLPPQSLWNSPLLAVAFVGLLVVEWVLRRRHGML